MDRGDAIGDPAPVDLCLAGAKSGPDRPRYIWSADRSGHYCLDRVAGSDQCGRHLWVITANRGAAAIYQPGGHLADVRSDRFWCIIECFEANYSRKR